LVFVRTLSRPLRTSWLIVGTVEQLQSRTPVPAHAKKMNNADGGAHDFSRRAIGSMFQA
jgi:hypothetical protein